jgi:hypothetical protein
LFSFVSELSCDIRLGFFIVDCRLLRLYLGVQVDAVFNNDILNKYIENYFKCIYLIIIKYVLMKLYMKIVLEYIPLLSVIILTLLSNDVKIYGSHFGEVFALY